MIVTDDETTGFRLYAHTQEGFKTGEFYISCTTILECIVHQSLKKYFQKTSAAKQEKVLTTKGNKGTDIHRLIEDYEHQRIEHQIDAYDNEQISRWEAQKTKHGIEILGTEKQVYSNDIWVAGTADYILKFVKDGQLIKGVGDLKTGFYNIKAGWQMAFYLKCYQKMYDKDCVGLIGISLPQDLSRRPDSFVYNHIDSCYKAYLSAWNCFRMLYWNQLEKLGWRGLKTDFDFNIKDAA